MAEINPPLYTQDGCTTAQQDRQLMAAYVCQEGVQNLAGGDLLVTDGPAGMQVLIASGDAFVQGDDVINQGVYYVVSDSQKTLTLANGDPTDPRTDLIIAEVQDTEYGDPSSQWVLHVVQGTPGPGAPVPSTPLNAFVLAQVAVLAGATTLSSGDITDVRPQAEFCGTMSARNVETIVYTANGTFDKADYPEARGFRVRTQASGGSGGGAVATGGGESSFGSGGSAGGFAESVLLPAAIPSGSVTITVGAAAVGTTGAGAAGNPSSFGTLVVANGGSGGGQSGSSSTPGSLAGITGGSAPTGQVRVGGGGSQGGFRISATEAIGGMGGNSFFGGGGRSTTPSSTGAAGNAYGAGGSGAANGASQSARAGGSSLSGVVIVEVL